VQSESTMRCLIGVIRPIFGGSVTARQRADCGPRQKIFAAALILIAAAAIISVAGVAKSAEPNANSTCSGPRAADGSCPQIATVLPCPGRMTADGLACCAPGSTPTGDDTCELPGGRLAASCPLAQLTSSGCCPSSSSPQPGGTCQPANGSPSASACPLSQLNQGGLSCCPAGQEPQADGSCAAPTCPGPMTADGRACCAPGSTPTGDDTCTLPSGGLAASCPLAQLTYTGTCCPQSSTPQLDGTCQPATGSSSASACPLGQLNKGGLSCCPFGQVPQADGSCQSVVAPTPRCPTGSTPNGKGQCLAALVCPAGGADSFSWDPTSIPSPIGANGDGYCCPYASLGAYVATTPATTTGNGVSEFGQTTCWTPGWCLDPLAGEGCINAHPNVPPTEPTCPPGSTSASIPNGPNTTFSCVQTGVEPSCPSPYVIFLNVCVLPDCPAGAVRSSDGICVAAKSVSSAPPASSPGQCPAGFVPREAYSGDRLCGNSGMRNQTMLDNIAAPSRTKSDGTCIQGYVWRQAIPSDHVCVTPATRTQAQSDNRTGVLACPIGQTRNASGACVCPAGEILLGNGTCGQAAPLSTTTACPIGQTRNASGACVCSAGEVFNADGKCVSAPGSQGPVTFPGIICPPGQVPGLNGTSCVCGAGQTMVGGKCESTQACPPGQIMVDGRCTVPLACPPGEVAGPNGNCVRLAPVKTPTPTTETPCPTGEERNADGACVKPSPPVAPCPPGEERTDRGCEKEPTQSNPNVQTPLKVLTPPKPVTVQKPVPPPKLNIAKPPPPRLNIAKPPPPAPKLPSGPEDKQKR
jgi:hypothetical protein